MFLGRLIAANFPHISTSAGLIERVTTFKLLGINFEANLSWSLHINTISAKASKHLYFLKKLKRVGLPTDQLLHFQWCSGKFGAGGTLGGLGAEPPAGSRGKAPGRGVRGAMKLKAFCFWIFTSPQNFVNFVNHTYFK